MGGRCVGSFGVQFRCLSVRGLGFRLVCRVWGLRGSEVRVQEFGGYISRARFRVQALFLEAI